MIRISGKFQIALSSTKRYSTDRGRGYIVVYDAFNVDATSARKTFLRLKQFLPESSGIAPNPLPNGATRFFIGSLQSDGYTGKDGVWVDNGFCMVVDSIVQLTQHPDNAVVYDYMEPSRKFSEMQSADLKSCAIPWPSE